jgi:hypothetical protein
LKEKLGETKTHPDAIIRQSMLPFTIPCRRQLF